MQDHNELEHKKRPLIKRSVKHSKKKKFQINDPRDPLDIPPKEIPIGKIKLCQLYFSHYIVRNALRNGICR